MNSIRWLVCCIAAVVLCHDAGARPPRYKACVEKPEFEKAEIVRDADKTRIEKPDIGRPQFEKANFDRMKKDQAQFQRMKYDRSSFDQTTYDTRCDIKKVVVRKPKKDTRYIPLEKRPYIPLEKRNPLAEVPKKATDCDCTASTTVPPVRVH